MSSMPSNILPAIIACFVKYEFLLQLFRKYAKQEFYAFYYITSYTDNTAIHIMNNLQYE